MLRILRTGLHTLDFSFLGYTLEMSRADSVKANLSSIVSQKHATKKPMIFHGLRLIIPMRLCTETYKADKI